MSQRLGMADGRCYTINSSNQLYNNYIMKENGISCLLYTSPSPRDP